MKGEIEKASPKALALGAVAIVLLPASFYFFLLASGTLPLGEPLTPGERRFALELGLFSGALGVWLTSAAATFFLRQASVSKKTTERWVDALLNPWATCAATIGLSLHAVWSLRGEALPHDPNEGILLFFGWIFLALSTAFLMKMKAAVSASKRGVGEASFEPSEIPCAPGGTAAATLTLEKRAASVEAHIELYLDGDKPAATLPASVEPAVQTPNGWTYRVTVGVPSTPVPDGKQEGWTLMVKARGEGGGVYEDSASIVIKPS